MQQEPHKVSGNLHRCMNIAQVIARKHKKIERNKPLAQSAEQSQALRQLQTRAMQLVITYETSPHCDYIIRYFFSSHNEFVLKSFSLSC